MLLGFPSASLHPPSLKPGTFFKHPFLPLCYKLRSKPWAALMYATQLAGLVYGQEMRWYFDSVMTLVHDRSNALPASVVMYRFTHSLFLNSGGN